MTDRSQFLAPALRVPKANVRWSLGGSAEVPKACSSLGGAGTGIPRGLGCMPANGVPKSFHLEQ
eukprot:3909197-Heterocapsa_arctica.AAC.1